MGYRPVGMSCYGEHFKGWHTPGQLCYEIAFPRNVLPQGSQLWGLGNPLGQRGAGNFIPGVFLCLQSASKVRWLGGWRVVKVKCDKVEELGAMVGQ